MSNQMTNFSNNSSNHHFNDPAYRLIPNIRFYKK